MKLSLRKIFDIVIASLGLLVFIFMFISYFGSSTNLWKFSTSIAVFMLLNILGIMAVYLLHLFEIFKDKWMTYANYAVGAVAFWHVSMFFEVVDHAGVGIWFGTIFSLAMFVISILWYLLGGKEGNKANAKKITGYDPKTGKPIYE